MATGKLMASPVVSVIVARTHARTGLSETLASVRAQTFTAYEIVISEPHDLLAQSRNRAIANCAGDYLSFIDAGQIWHSHKLAKQWACLAQSPELVWCYCAAAAEHPWSGDILRPLLVGNFIPSGSVMLRRGVLAAVGAFDESEICRSCEEWELWLRIAARYPAAVVSEALVDVLPSAHAGQRPISMQHVVEAAVSRCPNLRDLRSEALAGICMSAGNEHLLAGRREEARLHFAEALTHTPLRSDAYVSWASSYLSSDAQRQIRDLYSLSRFVQTPTAKKEPPLKRRR